MSNMRISGDFMKIIGEYNKTNKVNNVGRTQSVQGKKDVMTLSNQAKDYQVARKAVYEAPDIRSDKVKELEQKYASGTYNVSSNDVAEKLLGKALDTKA